jgi:hypothetical protein
MFPVTGDGRRAELSRDAAAFSPGQTLAVWTGGGLSGCLTLRSKVRWEQIPDKHFH